VQRCCLFTAPTVEFWKRDISSTSFFGDLCGCWTPSKSGVLVHKNSITSKLYHYQSWVVISRIWKNCLSDFKWSGHRLAHVFADGSSTASHKRERIGVVRFVSQEVWCDKVFVIWQFLNYCLEQIVSSRSLRIGVRIVFTTNELVDRTSNLESNASQNDQDRDFLWKNAPSASTFNEKKCAASKTYQTKCAAGHIFGLNPDG